MRRFPKVIVGCVLALALLLPPFPLCSTGGEQDEARPLRLLFIGNSYTYFNNLPVIFAQLADKGHKGRVETRMLAPGGWRLKDHWEKGEARDVLRNGKWDYVVLQEQSTLGVTLYVDGRPRIGSDEIFTTYAGKWMEEIRRLGAIPVLYLTWARKETPEDQAALNYAYVRAAREGGARIAPVGMAWARAREQQPSLELYDSDGAHPSPAGSYLAGCAFYAAIFHKSPAGLPARIRGIPIDLGAGKPEPEKTAVLVDLASGRAKALQNAAWEAYQECEQGGGFPNVARPPAISPTPLPDGVTLSPTNLEGTWSGRLLLYPPPHLPLEMVLRLACDISGWRGHLELRFHAKDQADESFDLTDLHVGERELTFSDPKGLQGLQIRFHGIFTSNGALRGNAEASSENQDRPLRLLGSWQLGRKP